jgi:hypothetical protein
MFNIKDLFGYKEFVNLKINSIIMGEWKQTDASCNQYGRQIADGIYEFKEDRIINPVTKETETFENEISLWDYSDEEKKSALDSFGYTKKELANWSIEDVNWITAECLFEESV